MDKAQQNVRNTLSRNGGRRRETTRLALHSRAEAEAAN